MPFNDHRVTYYCQVGHGVFKLRVLNQFFYQKNEIGIFIYSFEFMVQDCDLLPNIKNFIFPGPTDYDKWSFCSQILPQKCFQSHLVVRSGKISPNQETGLGCRGHLKVLNDTNLIQMFSCSFRTNFVSFRTFRRPLCPKPVSWGFHFLVGTFLPLLTAKQL